MPTGVRILITDQSQGGVLIDKTFPRLPVRIGRNPLNDLVVPNGYVSQFHVVVDEMGDQLSVRDLGSTNGTLFDGQRVAPNLPAPVPPQGFAIMSLHFQLTKVQAARVPAQSNRKPMMVTGLLAAPNFDLLNLQAQAPQHDLTEARRLYAAYRSAWTELLRSLQRQAAELPPERRPAFYAKVAGELPAILQEEDFRGIAPPETGALATGPKPDAVALAGLKELATDFAPDRPPPETSDDVVAFLSKIAEALDVFLKCFVPLREGYQQLAKELGVRTGPGRVTHTPGDADPRQHVERARDPKELGRVLLNYKDKTSEAMAAVESVFADYMIHQVAMMNGVMTGVKSLLQELSPESVERASLDPRRKKGLGFGPLRYKSLWDLYTELHADLAHEDRHVFSVLFGRKFAEAYDKSRESRDSTRT
ncbi:MAG: FHA domain-containing protein [Myxococcales bacterium]|nr:FHA domain-containing protein [Myxococcales bacterium]